MHAPAEFGPSTSLGVQSIAGWRLEEDALTGDAVATSTAAAEYIPSSTAASEILTLRRFLDDLGLLRPSCVTTTWVPWLFTLSASSAILRSPLTISTTRVRTRTNSTKLRSRGQPSSCSSFQFRPTFSGPLSYVLASRFSDDGLLNFRSQFLARSCHLFSHRS